MFENEMKHLFSDLEDKFPELTTEEREVLSHKESPILREGVRVIPNGGSHGFGRLVITKVIENETIFSQFLSNLIEKIRFPCSVTIDANGFMENLKGDIIFCFSSPNTGVTLVDNKQTVVLHDQPSGLKLLDKVEKLSNGDFLESWLSNHDLVSDYRGSGFKYRRIINLVVMLDPLFISVKKLMNQ